MVADGIAAITLTSEALGAGAPGNTEGVMLPLDSDQHRTSGV